MDPFMLHPCISDGCSPSGGSVMIAACVCGHCLSDINQATPCEQFMNDFRILK